MLVFYLVHEIPDIRIFFKKVVDLLKTGRSLLIVVPKGHLIKTESDEYVIITESAGLMVKGYPRLFFSRSMIQKKE